MTSTAYIDASGSTQTTTAFRDLAERLQDSGWTVYEFSTHVVPFDRNTAPQGAGTNIKNVVAHIASTTSATSSVYVFTDDDSSDLAELRSLGCVVAQIATTLRKPVSLLSRAEDALTHARQSFAELPAPSGNDRADRNDERYYRVGIEVIRACDKALREAERISVSVPASQQADLTALLEEAQALKVRVGREVFKIADIQTAT